MEKCHINSYLFAQSHILLENLSDLCFDIFIAVKRKQINLGRRFLEYL